MANESRKLVKQRQEPLRALYRNTPEEAQITDVARTTNVNAADAFHGVVTAGNGHGARWDFGIHSAVGGDHDLPNPGDILCASLATCLDSTLRMIAEHMEIALKVLDVSVTAHVDVRGCLMVDRNVPTGFRRIDADVRLAAKEGTDPTQVRMLIAAAEQCCVILQTLRSDIPVRTEFIQLPVLEAG